MSHVEIRRLRPAFDPFPAGLRAGHGPRDPCRSRRAARSFLLRPAGECARRGMGFGPVHRRHSAREHPAIARGERPDAALLRTADTGIFGLCLHARPARRDLCPDRQRLRLPGEFLRRAAQLHASCAGFRHRPRRGSGACLAARPRPQGALPDRARGDRGALSDRGGFRPPRASRSWATACSSARNSGPS